MRFILLFLSILSFIGLKKTFAETNVVVKSNGGSSHVNVVSKTSSGDSTTSESHVTIENNGEVKTFDVTGDESIDWTSDDGKSTVKINAQTITPSPKASMSPTVTKNEESKSTVSLSQDQPKKSVSLYELVKKVLQDIFSSFGR
ncbi:MAG: hypothetical protein HZC02_00575 [Candidatus Levybacteria bacterium]|nr:hypothetical protein [Candidatus Levybacteria bacterium]